MQVIGYTGNDDAKKYVLDGEVTSDKLKVVFASLVWLVFISLQISVNIIKLYL